MKIWNSVFISCSPLPLEKLRVTALSFRQMLKVPAFIFSVFQQMSFQRDLKGGVKYVLKKVPTKMLKKDIGPINEY